MILLVLAFSTSALSQDSTQIIKVKSNFWGIQFYQNQQKFTMKQMATIMERNEDAYKLIQSARSSNTMAGVLGAIGGAMIGWNIGEAIAGGDPNWTLSAVGGAIVLASIPIYNSAYKKSKQAVELYNAGLKTTSSRNTTELNFSIAKGNIGLKLSF